MPTRLRKILRNLRRLLLFAGLNLLLFVGFALALIMWPVAVAVLVLLLVMALPFIVSAALSPFKDSNRVLGRNLAIGPEWTTLTPQPSLRVEHSSLFLSIDLPTGAAVDAADAAETDETDEIDEIDETGANIVLQPGGPVVRLEVQLLDDQGATLELCSSGGHQLDLTVALFHSTELRRGKTLVALKIRSDQPFVSPKLKWHDYNAL